MPEKILLVDDDKAFCEILSLDLKEKGLKVIQAHTGTEGLKKFRLERPDFVVLDMKLPDTEGTTVFKQMKEIKDAVSVIIYTAFQETATTIECMKLGAYDYLCKPFDGDRLYIVLQRAMRDSEEKRKRRPLPPLMVDDVNEIVGKSPVMIEVFKQMGATAKTRAPILIQGESGTGKELIAKAIHHYSEVEGPFMAVNCSAIPETLSESELFGHEKGAFTGAIQRREGKFELANRGTLFLDEIGEMSPTIQAKFLRVLQDGEFERVGGVKKLKVDVRIIAATNRDLVSLILEGKFRQDLYHRLSTIIINVPPLRERREDIPLIVDYLIRQVNQKIPYPVLGVSDDVIMIFTRYDWPGNVRELDNILTAAATFARGGIICEQHLPKWLSISASACSDTPMKSLREVEREHIVKVLHMTGWNKGRACELLGISRPTLRKKMVQYGLSSLPDHN
ncbi:MAG: sigma-54-dependent Fis family transcriptional regulator [Candidatus Latescibacteria bacterium]|nr:sigma-54-dependent Fis family transcriptional regulator [Candidatus Latescibacterota bacterium]